MKNLSSILNYASFFGGIVMFIVGLLNESLLFIAIGVLMAFTATFFQSKNNKL